MLQIKNDYSALIRLQGCSYWAMEPRFSHWGVVGITLWCMNNIDNATPGFLLRPPDTEEVLSAMGRDLLPSLYVCLFMTLYDNNFCHFWPKDNADEDQELIKKFREVLENEYQLENNVHFARDVGQLFRPLRTSNGGPVQDWAIDAVIGV
ncbi:hypothetical protein DL766_005021 [Monosporascus sp. MC13-8B]|uniref:Uncharacterized protein n=1 Tax=Monosporascus cannonballus TaxID=155416 RepID=A0ABY0H974_9PEZI|nr:hypothetical protein DL762_004103 [Monosporascus cannonballus]RYO94375.1 hypothetical protein DL763_004091 [Monosporascus cannonballus]RYP30193.1 hypothetical protein DL766_005021 [Monosporascus sp. MC13-8B]